MLEGILKTLGRSPRFRDAIPLSIRRSLRKVLPISDYNREVWKKNNPYVGTKYEWEYKGKTPFTLGLIYDPSHYHRRYQSACLDLGVSYKVIDIISDNWLENIKKSECAGFLVWPHLTDTVLKNVYDERVMLISDTLKLPVYPGWREVWGLDNKRRVRDWLLANNYNIPETHVFYDKHEAYSFLKQTSYPLVFKTVNGSISKGVIICRSASEANKLVSRAFRKGINTSRMDRKDVQRNHVIFQEFLEDVHEKRMIRIGDSYLTIDKVRKGDFHSGSGEMHWGSLDRLYFDLTKELVEKADFRSMNVDFFITKDNRILINELHTVFGGPIITDEENKGMYTLDKVSNEWIYHPGNYYRNYCTNLRVLDFLDSLGLKEGVDRESWLNMPAFGMHPVD